MTTLKNDRILRFRDRLYQKKVPKLLRTGSDKLNPISRSRTDPQGNTIIPTKEIARFFHNHVKTENFIDADAYFDNLFRLFKGLIEDSTPYTFESDVQVSVEDIQSASNKKAIEYLTTNLIISFFHHASGLEAPSQNDFLTKDLKAVIAKSNEGRDYRELVGSTLSTMVETLKQNKPWRESLDDIQTAALVCRLVGARLPQIDKSVLSKIVSQARAEVNKELAVLTKILNTRDQLANEEKNDKQYLKAMKKLDAATNGLLKRIDTYLGYAHAFTAAINASIQGFLGPADKILKTAIAKLIFNFSDTDQTDYNPLPYSSARYRIGMLLDYPELTKFSLALKADDTYAFLFKETTALYYKEIISQFSLLSSKKHFSTPLLESAIGETLRLIETFRLAKNDLTAEKDQVKTCFLLLLDQSSYEQLDKVLTILDRVGQVAQDDSKELLSQTREILIKNCYATLFQLEIDRTSADELTKSVRKHMMGYSLYYRPQRFFFQTFFSTQIADPDGGLTERFSTMIQTHKKLAIALMNFFSNPVEMEGMMADSQIETAKRLAQRLLE